MRRCRWVRTGGIFAVLAVSTGCTDFFGGDGCSGVDGPSCHDELMVRIEEMPSEPGGYLLEGLADDHAFSCEWTILADRRVQGGGFCQGADLQFDPGSGRLFDSDMRGWLPGRLRLELSRDGVSLGSDEVQLDWRKEVWYEEQGSCAIECYLADHTVELAGS